MATKTLTIMEDAYDLLKEQKKKDESFSEMIRRIMPKRNNEGLKKLFGIISYEEGEEMIKDIEKRRKANAKFAKRRYDEIT